MDVMEELCSNIIIDAISPSRRDRSGPHRPRVSRKEARKQDREGKKRRRAEYFSSVATHSKSVVASPYPESPPPKRRTVTEAPRSQSSDLQSTSHLINRSTSPTLPRSRQEEDEDRYISLLEIKLTSGKKSKKGAGYVNDLENDRLGGELSYLLCRLQPRATTSDLLDDLDAITNSRSVKVCPTLSVSVKLLIPLYAPFSTTMFPFVVYAFPLDRVLSRVDIAKMKTMRALLRVSKSGMGFRM